MSYNYRKRHLTQDQQSVMVDFLEKHPDLVCGRAKVHGKMLWHVLAKKLNVVEGGVRRPSRLWAKTWFDKKSTLKKLLMNHAVERKRGALVSRVKWTALDLRIIKLLQQTGDLKIEDIDLEFIENTVNCTNMKESKVSITKTEQSDDDQESLPSHASSPTLPDGENSSDRFETIEYLDTVDSAQTNGKNKKKIANHRKDSEEDPLKAEWSRVASMEEQRIEIDQKSCRARQDTSEALKRCALAIESLAGAMNYQGALISEALKAQGDAIAEALKVQGQMIAEALGKR